MNRFLMATLICAACAGCVSLDVDSLLYQCSLGESNACGDGYFCARDNVCRPVGFDDSDLTPDTTNTTTDNNDTQDGTTTGCNCAVGQVCVENECQIVVDLTLGRQHSCARFDSGRMACWGDNAKYQVNPAASVIDPVLKPQLIDIGPGNILSACAGEAHTCALVDNSGTQELRCWGDNTYKQSGPQDAPDLIEGTTKVYRIPGLEGKLTSTTPFTCGARHTCVSTGDREVFCWGDNSDGQMGSSTPADGQTPIQITTLGLVEPDSIASITAGDDHTCVIHNIKKSLTCWGGINAPDKLGRGEPPDPPAPSVGAVKLDSLGSVNPSYQIDSIFAGLKHTCLLDREGGAWCWGSNEFGQLGSSQNIPGGRTSQPTEQVATRSNNPPFTSPIPKALEIDSGDNFACARVQPAAAGSLPKVYCWGQNDQYQLGQPQTDPSNIALVVADAPTPSKISTGGAHVCIIEAETLHVYCWGANDFSQLGNGSLEATNTPQKVFD